MRVAAAIHPCRVSSAMIQSSFRHTTFCLVKYLRIHVDHYSVLEIEASPVTGDLNIVRIRRRTYDDIIVKFTESHLDDDFNLAVVWVTGGRY